MAKYTEEQKKAVLARAKEIGVTAAAKETGISVTTVSKWNKEAAGKATDSKAAEKQEKSSAAKQKVKETAETIQEKMDDALAVAEIEVKKAAGKAKRAVKDTTDKIKAQTEKTVKKARAVNMDLIFETNGGLQIPVESIVEKVPKGCDAAYVKLEENKIYWVKGVETGSMDIW